MISSIIRSFDTLASAPLLNTVGDITGYSYGNGFHLASFKKSFTSSTYFAGLYISYDGINYKKTPFTIDQKVNYSSSGDIIFHNGIFYLSIKDVIDGKPPYYNYIYTTEDGINFKTFASFYPQRMVVVENNLFFITINTISHPAGIWDINFKNITNTLTTEETNTIMNAPDPINQWSWTNPEKYLIS